jgi:hypothetical protein
MLLYGADTGMLVGMGGTTPAERLAAGRAAGKTGATGAYRSLAGEEGAAAVTAGMRRYATVEGIAGKYSRSFARGILTSGGGAEMRTAMGTAGMRTFGMETMQMTDSFFKIANPLTSAFEKSGALRTKAASAGLRMSAISGYESLAVETVEKGIIKTLGAKGAMTAAVKGGSRVGLAVAGEAALAAIPGVNLIFAADMAYQLGKLGGHAIKGAINLGKDAMKSMQGNMRGGMFGTFKDNETAATSRARGVMAIQNSRLNARSLLGSEGAMMAEHYG